MSRTNLARTLFLADGWINRVRDCLFSDNHIGLHIWDQCNNVDVTGSNFYGNHIAVLAEEGAQIKLSGNCMEGGQGPAIIASSIYGLTVSSNYFEANNMCGPGRGHGACPLNLNTYSLGQGFNQSINADIVLNGVIDNLGDPNWVFGYVNAVADRRISAEFPCRSVVLEGNYHALYVETATSNGSMVLIGAVQGATIRSNDCFGGGGCDNCAIVTTGTDATIWGARDVSMERNTGWTYTGGAVRLVEKGCEHPWNAATRKGIQTKQGLLPWSCEVRLDTFADTPALCSGTNIGYGTGDNRHRQRPYSCVNPVPANFAPSLGELWASPPNSSSSSNSGGGSGGSVALPGFSVPHMSTSGAKHDGRQVFTLTAPPAAAAASSRAGGEIAAALVVTELPLATTPSAAGKSLALTVLARVATAAYTPHDVKGYNSTLPTLTLLVDRGDGVWLASNGGALSDWGGAAGDGAPAWMDGDWDVHSFSVRVGWAGTARMALAVAAGGTVELAMLKVAQIGA